MIMIKMFIYMFVGKTQVEKTVTYVKNVLEQ